MEITITSTSDQLTSKSVKLLRDLITHLVQTIGKNSVALYLHLLELLNSDEHLQFRSLARAPKSMGIDRTTQWQAIRELREAGLVDIDGEDLRPSTVLSVNTFGAGE